MLFLIYSYTVYIIHNQVNDLLIAYVLIFSHTFPKDSEHFCGINRSSPGEHCALKHVST